MQSTGSTVSGKRETVARGTAKSLVTRRRLSLLAFGLGLGSVLFSVIIVVSIVLQNRDAAEEGYRQRTQIEVQMLAATIDARRSRPTAEVVDELVSLWNSLGHVPSEEHDEHFVIADKDSDIILDTALPGTRHQPSPTESIAKAETKEVKATIVEVRPRVGWNPSAIYSDEFPSGSGAIQVGSLQNVSQVSRDVGRNWLLGIYRSKDMLHASALQLGKFRTLILVCGLAMPLSLVLMYYTYSLAQRGQVRAEEARSRLGAIVESSEDAIISQTFSGMITSWNRGAEHVFGHSEQEAIGRQRDELISSARPAEESQIIAQVREGTFAEEHSLETTCTCKDGRQIHVSQSISPIQDVLGRPVGVSIIARDITARMNLEREVLESASREQQRIGRELHDSLGQELTGLSYLGKSLQQKLAAAKSPHRESAETIMGGIQRALREVRRAVQGLVPVEVDASGFLVALEKLAADTHDRCGIECRVENSQPVPIDDNVLATHLFRIVQEAINNAVKHAQARQIIVRPEAHNGSLRVTIEDDGVGIAAQAARNGGMGLRIMRYRAGVIDATLDVQTTDGHGTSVVCLVKNKNPGPHHETA